MERDRSNGQQSFLAWWPRVWVPPPRRPPGNFQMPIAVHRPPQAIEAPQMAPQQVVWVLCQPWQLLYQPVPDARPLMKGHKRRLCNGRCSRGESCPYDHGGKEGPRRVWQCSRDAAVELFWKFKDSNAPEAERWEYLKKLIGKADLDFAWRHYKEKESYWLQNPEKCPARRNSHQ